MIALITVIFYSSILPVFFMSYLCAWANVPFCPKFILACFFGGFIGYNNIRLSKELALDWAKQEYEEGHKAFKKKLNEDFDKFYKEFEKIDPMPPC